jgi:hypothetical protein
VSGVPATATWNWTVGAGFGQSVVTVTITASLSEPLSVAVVTVSAAGALLPYTPSVFANASAGQPQPLVLSAPPGPLMLTNFSDPQVRPYCTSFC